MKISFLSASFDPSNSRTRLHAFNQYHNGKPNIKAILFSQIPDSNTQIEELKAKGVQAEGVVRHGHVAETLISIARENDATNIMIGRHGSSKLEARRLGIGANTRGQIADRPVTVVP